MKKLWIKNNWMAVLDIVKTLMLGVLLIITITLLNSIGRQTQQTKTLTQQNQALSRQNNELSKDISRSNQDIKSHIDCIITFFGLTNRQQLSIANVCHFVDNSAPSQTAAPAAKTSLSPSVQAVPSTNTKQNDNTHTTTNAVGQGGTEPTPKPTTGLQQISKTVCTLQPPLASLLCN